MKTTTSLLSFILLFVFAGCQDSSSDKQEDFEAIETGYVNTPGLSIAYHIGTPEGLTAIPRNEMPYPIIYAQFTDAIANKEDWMQVSEKVLNLKEEIAYSEPEISYFFLEQMAAVHIVGRAAFDSMFVEDYRWSDEQLGVLSKQVDILIKNRNPQSPIINLALHHLQGHWPDARLREAAFIAAEATNDWVEENKNTEMHEGMRSTMESFFYPNYASAADQLLALGNQLSIDN